MHSHSIADFSHSHAFLGDAHERNERKTWLVIAICATMMVAEIVGGLWFGSVALIERSDYGTNPQSPYSSHRTLLKLLLCVPRQRRQNDWAAGYGERARWIDEMEIGEALA